MTRGNDTSFQYPTEAIPRWEIRLNLLHQAKGDLRSPAMVLHLSG